MSFLPSRLSLRSIASVISHRTSARLALPPAARSFATSLSTRSAVTESKAAKRKIGFEAEEEREEEGFRRDMSKMEKVREVMGKIVFSEGYADGEGLRTLMEDGKWAVIESGKGIERGFKFKGFKGAWDFMNAIAAECKIQKHHPEWSNVYNTVFIRWTTHSPPGLSALDVKMAQFCDTQALIFNEIIPKPEEASNLHPADVKGRELADKVAEAGGDCCVPKRKAVEEAGEEK